MDILGLTPQALSDLLGQPLDSIELEKGTAELGGRSGSDVALVRVQPRTGAAFRVILKYLPPRYAHEPETYRLLHAAGAPLAAPYGRIEHADGAQTMALEYLPDAIIWPIPPDYHFAWVESLARLAALPLPDALPLERVQWPALHDKILDEMAYAIALDDAVLQDALQERDLPALLPRCRDHLPALLARADRLPTAFNHGEVYSQHTGRRTGGGEVLFFDLGASRVGPRFMDLIAAIIDHGEPYEVPTPDLARHFYACYLRESGLDLSWEDFEDEIALCRALVAFTWFQHVGFIEDHLGTADDNGELWNNPRKWVVLQLDAIKSYLDERNLCK